MSSQGTPYRNIVLISQVSICVMVPTFLCLALGIWLDKRFGTWFTLPLLILGMAAGARNAYVLVMNVIRQEEQRRKRMLEEQIRQKVDRANAVDGQKDITGTK